MMHFRRDVPLYATLLDTYTSSRSLSSLLRLHAVITTTGAGRHDFLRTKLCAAYAACSQIPAALRILSRANRRPTFLYNSLLRSLAALRRFPAALRLFPLIPAPDHRSFSTALRCAAALPSLPLGRALHAAALVAGLSPLRPVSNSLISLYAKSGDIVSARQVFDRMPDRDVVSYTAMIGACGDHGEDVTGLVEGLLADGSTLSLDAAAVTAVLSACARVGLTELGVRVFDATRRPTVEQYTCMVELFGRAGMVVEAERMVAGMEVEPDKAMLRALLALRARHEGAGA